MRVLVVFAHPVEASFAAALRDCVTGALRPRHEVDLLDLHAEGFDPVMSRSERLGYHDMPGNRTPVQAHIDRLMAANALVLCFPAWTFGPPAILKGWFDRVMLPGVAFHIGADGHVRGGFRHMRKVAGVVTYGQARWKAALMGDYPRRLVRRLLRRNIGGGPAPFLAHYRMNVSTDDTRRRFLLRVERTMRRF